MPKDTKQSLINYKDKRKTKTDEETKLPSKKDTRKWCKGKKGVEHKLVCKNYAEVKHPSEPLNPLFNKWRLLVCEVCGKELKFWCGRMKNKPDWVDC